MRVRIKINKDLLITVRTDVDSFHDKEDIFQMQNLQKNNSTSYYLFTAVRHF